MTPFGEQAALPGDGNECAVCRREKKPRATLHVALQNASQQGGALVEAVHEVEVLHRHAAGPAHEIVLASDHDNAAADHAHRHIQKVRTDAVLRGRQALDDADKHFHFTRAVDLDDDVANLPDHEGRQPQRAPAHGNGRANAEITRFKGLGEMMPKVLWETTLNPRTRRLLRVEIADQIATDRIINELMGKDASARFRFMAFVGSGELFR